MSIWSQTYQQSVFKRYHSDKYFSAFLPTRWWQKSTVMDMEQNYVTVTLCISCTYHAYLNGHVQCGFSWSLSPPKVITDRYCCCLQAKCMNPRSADLNLKVQTVFWYGNHKPTRSLNSEVQNVSKVKLEIPEPNGDSNIIQNAKFPLLRCYRFIDTREYRLSLWCVVCRWSKAPQRRFCCRRCRCFHSTNGNVPRRIRQVRHLWTTSSNTLITDY